MLLINYAKIRFLIVLTYFYKIYKVYVDVFDHTTMISRVVIL